MVCFAGDLTGISLKVGGVMEKLLLQLHLNSSGFESYNPGHFLMNLFCKAHEFPHQHGAFGGLVTSNTFDSDMFEMECIYKLRDFGSQGPGLACLELDDSKIDVNGCFVINIS